MLKRDEKALIDLVNGMSSGSVLLVGVADGDLANHDARLEAEPLNVSQAMTIMRRPLRRHFSLLSECLLVAATRLFLAARLMKVGYSECVVIESRQASWSA